MCEFLKQFIHKLFLRGRVSRDICDKSAQPPNIMCVYITYIVGGFNPFEKS